MSSINRLFPRLRGGRQQALRAAACSGSGHAQRRHINSKPTMEDVKRQWGPRIVMSEEVEDALLTGDRGVVALETAIVTHGMPHPTNLSTALSVEHQIRSHSTSIPATIGLIDGRIHIGLTRSELERMADPSTNGSLSGHCHKVSRRDLASAITHRWTGGTTVAGTMLLARSVGIDVFVTGGIGGVHRGAEQTMDVSADLHELAQTSSAMGVVCAGAKSILDIGLTLEVLESLGVAVATVSSNDGQPVDFPAFYSPRSGFASPLSVPDVDTAASLLHTSLRHLPSPLSTLFAVPIPSTHHADGAFIQQCVERAVKESIECGVNKRGKEVTPWLLKRVGELTQGKALQSNIALIENNARFGGKLAERLCALDREEASSRSSSSLRDVIILGSAAIDVTAKIDPSADPSAAIQSTARGSLTLTPGGVGRNIAECATRLLGRDRVLLVSPIGGVRQEESGRMEADDLGKTLLRRMEEAGMDTSGMIIREPSFLGKDRRTAGCSLVLAADGDLTSGVADMSIVETLSADEIKLILTSSSPKLVAFDANINATLMKRVLELSKELGFATLFEPTSIDKIGRIASCLTSETAANPMGERRLLTHFTPNSIELAKLGTLIPGGHSASWEVLPSESSSIISKNEMNCMLRLSPWVEHIWLKRGAQGVLHFTTATCGSDGAPSNAVAIARSGTTEVAATITNYPADVLDASHIVSTTGAGDSFVGGLIAGFVETDVHNVSPAAVQRAMQCARLSMESEQAVAPSVVNLRRIS